MIQRTLALSLLSAVLVSVPLSAGEVFIPYASNRTIGGTTYRTKVWVTNTGAAVRRFTTLFIESGTDGNKLSDPDPTAGISVGPGTTAVISTTAPEAKLGMLEIQGAPQIVATARLEALDASGAVLSSANLPVISQANAAPAKSIVDLQGLGRQPGATSDFVILNLSRKPTRCTVNAFRASGSRIGQAVVFALSSLSQQPFNDLLAAYGEGQIADTHFQVSCDQQFYAFAMTYGGSETDFIAPSAALVNDLVPGSGPPSSGGSDGGGGTGGGTGGGGGGASVVFNVPGTFLVARNGNSYVSYDLPAQNGVPYRRAVIEYDMHISKFDPVLLFTGVTSFRRPHADRNLRVVYYAIQIVNRNSKTTLDLGVTDVLVKTDGPWKANGTYHVRMTYDVPSHTVSLEALQNNQVIYTIAGPAQHLDLSAQGADHPLRVDFGQTGIADGAYTPPYGWSFANLHAELIPQ